MFISYSRVDQDFAFRLAASLKNAGVATWIDQFEIRVGQHWQREIEKALNTSSGCIAILSPDYVASEICRNELDRASDLKVPIYPVLLRRFDPASRPLSIQSLQHASFLAAHEPTNYDAGFAQLIAAIHRTAPAQITAPPGAGQRYLNTLIAELESKRGILQYLDLQTGLRDRPPVHDEWGFALLNESGDETRSGGGTPASIRQVAAETPRFVLTGDPGAGKTTTLRRLALEQARDRLRQGDPQPIPVLLALPKWPSDQSIHQFIRSNTPFESDPTDALRCGRMALYLDGLNELGAEGPKKVKELNQWIESSDAPARLIVTCRRGEDSDLKLARLPLVVLEPLDEPAIVRFVHEYLGSDSDKFLQQIRSGSDQRSLLRLAANPYMLSALIYLFQNSKTEGIPRSAGQLFQRLVRALWERERQRATAGWQPFETVEPRLATLAYDMIDLRKGTAVEPGFVHDRLGAELVPAVLGANLLITSGDSVSFYHQAMQEYFAAIRLAQEDIVQKLPSPDYSRRQIWRRTDQWDQVVAVLLGLRSSDQAFIHTIGAIDPYYLGLWHSSVGGLPEGLTEQIFGLITEALCDGDWKRRIAAIHAMSKMGGERAAQAIIPLLEDPHCVTDGGGYEWKVIYAVRTAAAWALGQIGDPGAVPALMRAAADPVNAWATPNFGNRNASLDALRSLRLIGNNQARKFMKKVNRGGQIEYLVSYALHSSMSERNYDLYQQMLRDWAAEVRCSIPTSSLEAFPASYTVPGRTVFLAFEYSLPAAFAAASQTHDGAWTLDYFYVKPAFRRIGTGRHRLTKLLTHLSSGPSLTVSVTLPSSEKGPLLFFKANGFKPVQGKPLRLEYRKKRLSG